MQRLMSTLRFEPITFTSGSGAYLYDEKGRKYLDFFCDVGTASLGYSPKPMREALERMISEGIPLHAPNRYGFKERDRAAERLCTAADMERVFFCNSGTEAVEAAIKCSRLYQHLIVSHTGEVPMKHEIWSMSGGFHGRTYGGLSAGDGPRYHTDGFGPLLPGFRKFKTVEDIDPQRAAAVLLAPVFGNNDVRLIPTLELEDIRGFCTEYNIALIFDEVQTGAGRTGGPGITYAQQIGVKPDMITLAKGIAMGSPVGALLANAKFGGIFTPGTHFSTFGGNPLSCVMVNAMLDWLQSYDALGMGKRAYYMEDRLRQFAWAKNIRRAGMLLAFDYEGNTVRLAEEALKLGLLIGAFRDGPGAVKLTPPLNSNLMIIDEGIVVLEKAHQAANNG